MTASAFVWCIPAAFVISNGVRQTTGINTDGVIKLAQGNSLVLIELSVGDFV